MITKIPANCDYNKDDDSSNSGNGKSSDNGEDLFHINEDCNKEEIAIGNNEDHSECIIEKCSSDLEEDSENDDILSPTIASVVKSPLKRNSGVKVMSLLDIDDSHLKLDYNHLILIGLIRVSTTKNSINYFCKTCW